MGWGYLRYLRYLGFWVDAPRMNAVQFFSMPWEWMLCNFPVHRESECRVITSMPWEGSCAILQCAPRVNAVQFFNMPHRGNAVQFSILPLEWMPCNFPIYPESECRPILQDAPRRSALQFVSMPCEWMLSNFPVCLENECCAFFQYAAGVMAVQFSGICKMPLACMLSVFVIVFVGTTWGQCKVGWARTHESP